MTIHFKILFHDSRRSHISMKGNLSANLSSRHQTDRTENDVFVRAFQLNSRNFPPNFLDFRQNIYTSHTVHTYVRTYARVTITTHTVDKFRLACTLATSLARGTNGNGFPT